jgi:hypothetical protein
VRTAHGWTPSPYLHCFAGLGGKHHQHGKHQHRSLVHVVQPVPVWREVPGDKVVPGSQPRLVSAADGGQCPPKGKESEQGVQDDAAETGPSQAWGVVVVALVALHHGVPLHSQTHMGQCQCHVQAVPTYYTSNRHGEEKGKRGEEME